MRKRLFQTNLMVSIVFYNNDKNIIEGKLSLQWSPIFILKKYKSDSILQMVGNCSNTKTKKMKINCQIMISFIYAFLNK